MSSTLEDRVARLEQAVAGSVAADGFAPSAGQVIDAQGRVSYDFDGHVRARGLDLSASTTATPFDDQKVRWLRESDGAYVAFLAARTGIDVGGRIINDAFAEVRNTNPSATQSIRQRIQTGDGVGVARSDIQAAIDVTPSDIAGEGFTRQVLDGNGATDFMLARGCHAFFFSNPGTVIANGAAAQLALQSTVFDVTDVDGGGGVMRTQKVGNVWTCRRAGLYFAGANFLNAVGGFGCTNNIRQNGGITVSWNVAGSSAFPFRVISCAVGDTVDLTSANATGAAATFSGWLMISRIGALSWL